MSEPSALEARVQASDPRARPEERLQIRGMQAAVIAHAPPAEHRPQRLQYQPGGDVGLVIQVGDDDLVARPERLPDGQTHEPDERGRVQAEGDFLGTTRIEERRHSLARALDGDASTASSAGSGRRAARCGPADAGSPPPAPSAVSGRRRHCRKRQTRRPAAAPETVRAGWLRGTGRRLRPSRRSPGVRVVAGATRRQCRDEAVDVVVGVVEVDRRADVVVAE